MQISLISSPYFLAKGRISTGTCAVARVDGKLVMGTLGKVLDAAAAEPCGTSDTCITRCTRAEVTERSSQ